MTVLGSQANPLASRLIASLADLALVVDLDGKIVDVASGEGLGQHPGWRKLVGKRWVDVLTPESRGKVEPLLREAAAGHTTRSRELNLHVDGVGELPFRFTGVLVDERHVLALGIDLRPIASVQQSLVTAQQAMELEYERVRQSEAQYRVLFHVCGEAVLLTRGPRQIVEEANPAALKLLATTEAGVQGKALRDLVSPESRDELAALLASVEAGRAIEVPLRMRVHGQADLEFRASATMFRQSGGSVLLLRFWPLRPEAGARNGDERVLKVLEAMPDAFVVTDDTLSIVSANASFCELVERASEAQVIGTSLDRWLGRAGVDVNIITSNLREHGLIRNFATVIRSDFGAERPATVTAVATPDEEVRCYGFTIRATLPLGRMTSLQSRSTEQLQALVGRATLKEIVQESADMIERLCIEAALEISGNNRAAAAQLLGLSRQSLYTKLRRHGMEAFSPTDEDAERPAE